MVELKAVKALEDVHRMQCTNYLKATGLRLYLLRSFGKLHLEIKRVVQPLNCTGAICIAPNRSASADRGREVFDGEE